MGAQPAGATGESGRVIRKLDQPELFEVLERILDKGIVIDDWVRFSVLGVDFSVVEVRIVVESIEICLEYTGPVQRVLPFASPPRILEIVHRSLLARAAPTTREKRS